jgi:hypothetical protein
VGIILAMAGLDYSYVREPEYRSSSLRQSEDISRYIAQEADAIYELWSRREEIREKVVCDKKYIRNNKTSTMTPRDSRASGSGRPGCHDCGGLVMIDSRSDLGIASLPS